MAWTVGSWLLLARRGQMLTLLASASMNGFLIGYIYTKRLGLRYNMVALQLMVRRRLSDADFLFVLMSLHVAVCSNATSQVCILLVVTAVVMMVYHTGGRSRQLPWLASSIVVDVVLYIVDMAIMTVLANAGVPQNCVGLTRWNCRFPRACQRHLSRCCANAGRDRQS